MKKLIKRFFKYIVLPGFIFGIFSMATAYIYAKHAYQSDIDLIITRATQKELKWQSDKYPSLSFIFNPLRSMMVPEPSAKYEKISTTDITQKILNAPLYPVGPSPLRKIDLSKYPADPNLVTVYSIRELQDALKKALPGDIINISPGDYLAKGRNIPLVRHGTARNPIILRAKKLGDVRLKFDLVEGFLIAGSYWRVENLIIEGICKQHNKCDHAFHIVGKGHHAILRNNIIKNFNASIKINASGGNHPNNGLLEYNIFHNDSPRETWSPVTLIDGVATDDWIVRHNIIADFAKLKGDHVSYAAFFKGAGRNNIFEKNLVMCEWQHRGGIRLGLSFGGGGTGAKFCPNNDCSTEHFDGVIRNNIIMNCPYDVGIYLNRSADTVIHNNIMHNTHGIDVRFPTSSANIYNNIIDGRIKNRHSGVHGQQNNITDFIKAITLDDITLDIYKDPQKGDFRPKDLSQIKGKGIPSRSLGEDFCGIPHMERGSDIGPFNLQVGNLQTGKNCSMNFDFISQYLK